MKVRSLFLGAAALVAVAITPGQASAQVGAAGACPVFAPTVVLGLGGSLSGCFNYSVRELGEDAFLTSPQAIWDGVGGTFALTNNNTNDASQAGGTLIYNDDCGSGGGSGGFFFCPNNAAHTVFGYNATGEMVLGLFSTDHTYGFTTSQFGFTSPNNTGYWNYSGNDPNRNLIPGPAGKQMVLMQVVDALNNPIAGEFLFAWEDLNTPCTSMGTQNTTFAASDLTNAGVLETHQVGDCALPAGSGGNSDSDYNDSYLLLNITATPQNVTPEPMTMTLMATGLIGLGGASLRRRKKN